MDGKLHEVGGLNIRTSFDYPPIPIRNCDWSAIDHDTYDGAPECNCPIGRGATEAEAVADLLEQIEEAGLHMVGARVGR